ncbi:PspA/IM30 family protein [Acidovorax sp. NCPPB 2350]|nr:PspA/IM30 family protein [Acidovorax sp. NCPPB 2350]
MADSLKTRVGRVIAGSVHALVDRLENQAPEAVMEQSIREVDAVISDVRHELGLVSANRHLAQQQHSHLNAQHETLAGQTQQALDAGRDDLARAAVARQLDIEAQIPVLETALAEHVRKEDELKGYVTALLAKKRQMAEALEEFIRSRAPAAHPDAAPGAGARAQDRMESATGAFDRLYQRHTGLSPSAAGATLEQATRLKDLEELVRQSQIEERMAQLRTR